MNVVAIRIALVELNDPHLVQHETLMRNVLITQLYHEVFSTCGGQRKMFKFQFLAGANRWITIVPD